jgi:alpha-L-fucosidase
MRQRDWMRRIAARLGVLTVVASIGLVALGAAPAQADVQNPRQTWLRNSTAGLFLHWGLRTDRGPGKTPWTNTDCANWENEVTSSGWNANYWADEALKLHASYLVLASFHSRLGYARAWPSKVPGSCSTKRDFLGETIAAAKAKGLKVILYMTDDPQWYWEGLQPTKPPADDANNPDTKSWFDSRAYAKWKGHDANLNTRPGFGEFSYDNFFEVMRNYPDLGGFWIDNDNAYWEDHKLYEQVHQLRPNMLLSNNNEDTPEMDTVSNEQKTGMTPPYDYNSALWTSMPRLTESDYKLPNQGGWWYDGEAPGRAGQSPVDKKLNVGRLISNVGASSKALEAETAKVNGRFPANQEDYNNFSKSFLDPIWESVNLVEGGGYMYGGLQPGRWNDGAYGFTTIAKRPDQTILPERQYIHVVDRPSGSTLKVRDNGYVVTKVTDLRTGQAFDFSQSAGTLTINGVTAWDQYDTVFKVTTSGRTGLFGKGTLKATANAAAAGHDANALVDGDFTTYWQNTGTAPNTITLDLGSARKLAYLAVNQREWSSTQRRTSFGHPEDSARIKQYAVDVSDDGQNWTSVVSCATMPSARGVQFVDLNVAKTRYARLTIKGNWSAPELTEYFNQLKIDEIAAGDGYAGGGAAPVTPSDCATTGGGAGGGGAAGGTGGGSGLPITGAQAAYSAAAGGALLALGAFLVVATRRRRTLAA